jgi:hypothetical protein
MIEQLKIKARQQGRVRVIATIRPSNQDASVDDADAKARQLAQIQTTVAQIMRDAGALLVQPIQGRPLVVMELTENELDVLLHTGYVESVQEDRMAH